LFLLIGIGAIVAAVQEYRLGAKADEKPQTLTCRQLIDKGPGDNLHVVVTDYVLEVDSFVVEEKKRQKDNWNKVWIPLSPLDGKKTEGKFHVILQTDRAHKDADLVAIQKAGQIHGMVVNDVASLGSKEEGLLRQSYPKTDFAKCWIIQHERGPKTTTDVLLYIIAGVVALLAGLALIVSWMRGSKE
jgi:hypothetical protein